MYLVFLSDFNEIWIFSTGSNRSFQYHIQQKIHFVGTEPILADRQMDRWVDMMKLMGTFNENSYVPNKIFATVPSV